MSPKRRPHKASQQYWIGYCRKSTETEDRQIHSLEDQAALVRAYYDRLPPEEKANRPLKLFEEAKSAYRPGRPVFGQILRMATRGAVWGVIVVHPNRISRNHTDSGAFVQHLVDAQIECLDTASGKRYTGADSNDIFMLTLEGAMSWKDSRDKGDRILVSMHNRAREGRYMTRPPLGYRIVYQQDGSKSLQVDPRKAPAIRTLFDLAATGSHSLEDLAAEAERLGLVSRKGGRMHKSCLHKLLTNPFFKGQVRFDGILAQGIHEALVTEGVWQRVQRALSGRRPVPAEADEPSPHDPFVFRGLLRCPGCPRKLCGYRAKRRYIYYECKNPRTKCGVCVAQPKLLGHLEEVLARITLGPEDLAEFRQRLLQLHQQRTGDAAQTRQRHLAECDRLQKEIARTFEERAEADRLGIRDVVEERLRELVAERDAARGRLATLDDTGPAWVEKAIRALELISLLTEAIRFGPPHPRALALQALASNFSVKDDNLVLTLKSPFRQVEAAGGRLRWWDKGDEARTLATLVDELRTEVGETLDLLEAAYSEWRGE